MFADYRCCNSCDDVKKAYKMKNWDFHPSNIEQCKNQTFNNDVPDNAFKEGCQIYGILQVNRVSTENVLRHFWGLENKSKLLKVIFYGDILVTVTKPIL